MDSSGIAPLISPKSPTGLQSKLGVKPDLQGQKKPPWVFLHSVEAASHWLLAHSLISSQVGGLSNSWLGPHLSTLGPFSLYPEIIKYVNV